MSDWFISVHVDLRSDAELPDEGIRAFFKKIDPDNISVFNCSSRKYKDDEGLYTGVSLDLSVYCMGARSDWEVAGSVCHAIEDVFEAGPVEIGGVLCTLIMAQPDM